MRQCKRAGKNLQSFSVSLKHFSKNSLTNINYFFLIRSGVEGKYPDLENCAYEKLKSLAPNR